MEKSGSVHLQPLGFHFLGHPTQKLKNLKVKGNFLRHLIVNSENQAMERHVRFVAEPKVTFRNKRIKVPNKHILPPSYDSQSPTYLLIRCIAAVSMMGPISPGACPAWWFLVIDNGIHFESLVSSHLKNVRYSHWLFPPQVEVKIKMFGSTA